MELTQDFVSNDQHDANVTFAKRYARNVEIRGVSYKGRSILVRQKLPKIATRCRLIATQNKIRILNFL